MKYLNLKFDVKDDSREAVRAASLVETCAQCGGPADRVAGWRIDDPSRFGLDAEPGTVAIYCPACVRCLEAGFDTDLAEMEALAAAGFPVMAAEK